jgi:hypothetical protein
MKTKNVLVLGSAVFAISYNLYPNKKIQSQELSAIQKTLEEQIPSKASINTLSNNLMFSLPQEEITTNFTTSLAQFIKEHFNEPTYANYLSQNGEDIISLLKIVKNTDLLKEDKPIYAYTVLKLFHEKMKAARLVDDTVIHHIMNAAPSLLADYLVEKPIGKLDHIKQMMEQNIIKICTSNKATFDNQPDLLIPMLSENLAQESLDFQQDCIDRIDTTYKLRSMIVRFFEGMLSKITWSRSSYESIWGSFLSISHDINKLYKSNIFDDEDDRDSLWWSLIHGLTNYLDIVGSAFPLSFYSAIKDDINNCLIPFLEKEEQDDCITTKKEVLLEVILQAEMKAYAFEKEGIFSDHFVNDEEK